MAEHDPFLASLRDLRELETVLHELLASLTKQRLRHEENVVPYAEKLGVAIPGSKAELSRRAYPGLWGGTSGTVDHSAGWENKTARYFRKFLASGEITGDIIL